MDHRRRLGKLGKLLAQNRLDSLLITHLPNVHYLCGFTGSAAVLLITELGACFFSDGRYASQAQAEVQGARIAIARKPPLLAASEWICSHRKSVGTRIGIEAENLTVASQERLKENLGQAFRLKSTQGIVEQLRMIKDEHELCCLREAARLGANIFDQALKMIRPGIPETRIAGELESVARDAGANSMSFPTIVASGARSALPHGVATSVPIPVRGFVVCDFGVILAGYCSDQTRTVHVGKPSPESRRVYAAVKESQQAGLDAVRPGCTVGEVDRAVRSVLRRAKLSKYFPHSTGHGVGLEIHEAPRIAAGQQQVLSPGMVVTIEPGVYIPGKLGVRIEDMVVVNDQGCEVLTPTSKELTVV